MKWWMSLHSIVNQRKQQNEFIFGFEEYDDGNHSQLLFQSQLPGNKKELGYKVHYHYMELDVIDVLAQLELQLILNKMVDVFNPSVNKKKESIKF